MSKIRSVAVSAALLAVVGAGGYFVWQSRQEPTGLATGRAMGAANAGKLWTRLQTYKDGYLRRYFAAFEKDAPSATDALEAFNELAYQVTGPGGFWRKEVPNRWLGCKSQPDSASCGAISALSDDLGKWDALQEQIVGLNDGNAGRFLDEHMGELSTYLDTLVPDEPSSAGMQKTPVFEKGLKAAMQQDGML